MREGSCVAVATHQDVGVCNVGRVWGLMSFYVRALGGRVDRTHRVFTSIAVPRQRNALSWRDVPRCDTRGMVTRAGAKSPQVCPVEGGSDLDD